MLLKPLSPVPILDFWGPYGGSWDEEQIKRICPCFTLSQLRKALETYFPQLSTLFFYLMQDCTTFTLHGLTDFYVEKVRAHRIKIIDHSCFHNRWSTAKTKLKWKPLWEQGGPPGVLGPYAAYSAYRWIGSDCRTRFHM